MKTSPKEDVALIAIGSVLIEPEVIAAKFRCDLKVCKGACCVVGEKGAPVLSQEVEQIEKNLDKVKKYLPEKNRKIVETEGIYEAYRGDLYLMTVEGRECVFANINENGIAECMLEHAFEQGETDFQKPISCHLYPIRVRARLGTDYLVYSQIPECEGGRACGAAQGVPMVEFLVSALRRKYGEEWTEKLLDYARFKRL
ncbi:MAG: DUF3109 family protein [Candidatus Thermochlorobacter sp.]